eukprot:TRINITY_DN1079_c0_g1_i1.p1 TRINITY_DN1079_c0_g1~~TRINITY_DN1079_c0_g1_i1.p1  ORF type:complete len:190 (-),score=13.54 TRINITY_DN1079_c0_g1_i1:540-1109(-)
MRIGFVPILFFILVLITSSFFFFHTRTKSFTPKTLLSRQYFSHSSSTEECRNTHQGKLFITDELGYKCKRDDWNVTSGCCTMTDDVANNRYSCKKCEEIYKCCHEYEECVSCCLGTGKSVKQMEETSATLGRIFDFLMVDDMFSFCSLRCRSSSSSVIHQNTYRSQLKYCFGEKESPLLTNNLVDMNES